MFRGHTKPKCRSIFKTILGMNYTSFYATHFHENAEIHGTQSTTICRPKHCYDNDNGLT